MDRRFALLPPVTYPTLIFVCPSPPFPHAMIYSQAPALPTVTHASHSDTHCLAQHHSGDTNYAPSQPCMNPEDLQQAIL